MIAAAESGTLVLDKLEAMTCVCSVGLGYDCGAGGYLRCNNFRHYRRRVSYWHGQF